jgi:photosystem II stability/assembly factor-like uncharacterized protein
MKISRQKSRVVLVSALQSVAIILAVNPLSAQALEDELQMPAMKTEIAQKSVLTDVTRAGDRLVAVGVRGHILLSDDAGAEWVQADVPVRVNLTAVTFVNDRQGWASGHCGIVLHTADGGETWTKQLDGSLASRIILESTEQEVAALEQVVAAAGGEAGEDLLWDLETATWRLEDAQRDVEVGPAKPIMDVWFKNDREGYAVGAYGYFLHTTDGGKTWEDYAPRIDNPDSLHLYAINGLNGDVLFIVGEEGGVHRSMDGGDTWQSLDSPYVGGLFGVFGTDLRGQVYILGLNGNIFHSVDFGDNWQPVDTQIPSSLFGGLILPDKGQVFVGQDGVLLVCGGGRGSCAVVPREDRQTLSAAVLAGDSQLLVVGMGGMELLNLPPSPDQKITKARD